MTDIVTILTEEPLFDPLNLLVEQDKGRMLHQSVLDFFTASGVNGLSLARTPWGDLDFVNIDEVVWLPHGAFEFARYCEGKEADSVYTFVVRDVWGDPLDIIAWQTTGGRVATWLGRASLIGEDQLFAPRLTDGLSVFETPMQWFQERRTGVVVVDKVRAAPKLRDAAPLLAQSFEHGKRLRQMLRVTPPRILVPSSMSEAA